MLLAGDIGGTNARVALFEVSAGRLIRTHQERLASRSFDSFEDVLLAFLRSHPATIEAACFGLPGPVKQRRVATTNLPWIVEAEALSATLGLKEVWLLNDLEALAWGLDALGPEEFLSLQKGAAPASGNRAVIAAGTGLGEAGLYWNGQEHLPFATEGGHADFAPADELQGRLLNFLRTRHGHVSWERLVTGEGLVSIHEFLRDVERVARPARLPPSLVGPDPAATITRAALARACPLAERSLDLFAALYGAEAGNLAIKMMATGGLYVAGGIAPKILPKFQEPAFLEAFRSKGRMRPVLESMPVWVVLDEDVGLRGAARYGARLARRTSC